MNNLFVLAVLTIAKMATAGEVCYESLGCFSDSYPFTSLMRPVSHLPWSPDDIGTTFWLFTRYNQFAYQLLSYNDAQSIVNSNFRAIRKTKFIIHGFSADGDSNWIMDLKNAILNVENANVIVVDWRQGAGANIYGQAATNTRVVGAEINELITRIKEVTTALSSDFHLIGHSLGAHVSGYAGERMLNLGRITGLDPADPYFQGTPFMVRLDPSDAHFVDVIHTDGDPFYGLGWGMMDPVGHVDFYPNGGRDQPGCPGNEVIDGQWWKISCSHSRAHELIIDSIVNSDTPMYGYTCSDYDSYKAGQCTECDTAGCPTLGYYSDQVADSEKVNVKYYLITGEKSPYAIY